MLFYLSASSPSKSMWEDSHEIEKAGEYDTDKAFAFVIGIDLFESAEHPDGHSISQGQLKTYLL